MALHLASAEGDALLSRSPLPSSDADCASDCAEDALELLQRRASPMTAVAAGAAAGAAIPVGPGDGVTIWGASGLPSAGLPEKAAGGEDPTALQLEVGWCAARATDASPGFSASAKIQMTLATVGHCADALPAERGSCL
eukprot:CAMPEP_0204109956 /NCGR_PEP_ID=MMETSP0361-20130328/1607_1 /ASSEMBLY_ACC=CAM_ASM_000343 /TAXON_ID=268821 /ORGANISM="Scrippsiella Hangoei, Strain SHTV-5" /LENGTH=138 /DNA_ID=CAMNT_0051059801 /DNA_START=102 /DNA_END=515 /DNA_ORIENTATION=+